MTDSEVIRFFGDLESVMCTRAGNMDVYAPEEPGGRQSPAVIFVHGGPIAPDQEHEPRDWEGYGGYATLAARAASSE